MTADSLSMCCIVVKCSHFIRRKLDNYLLHFKQRNCQTERVIIDRENFGDPQSDVQHIQYRLLSLCETFCSAGIQPY
jgi:hypothetical protein